MNKNKACCKDRMSEEHTHWDQSVPSVLITHLDILSTVRLVGMNSKFGVCTSGCNQGRTPTDWHCILQLKGNHWEHLPCRLEQTVFQRGKPSANRHPYRIPEVNKSSNASSCMCVFLTAIVTLIKWNESHQTGSSWRGVVKEEERRKHSCGYTMYKWLCFSSFMLAFCCRPLFSPRFLSAKTFLFFAAFAEMSHGWQWRQQHLCFPFHAPHL